VLISETILDPTPTNTTWAFNGTRVIELDPGNIPKADNKKLKQVADYKDSFQTLYIKISCLTDFSGSADVFFPREDERKQRELEERKAALKSKEAAHTLVDISSLWVRDKRVNVKQSKEF